MAKRAATKKAPAKKPAAKATKKAAKPSRPAGKASSAAAIARGPVQPINTGKGPGPDVLGRKLVEMFNAMTSEDAIWAQLFAKDFTSIEGHGVNMMFTGRKTVEHKNAEFTQQHIIHGARAEGPYVGSTGFAVKFTVDVEVRATGAKRTMTEVAVYTVQDGKVIQEEFMYGM